MGCEIIFLRILTRVTNPFVPVESLLASKLKKKNQLEKNAYMTYFVAQVGDQDKPCGQHSLCKTCVDHRRQ